MTRLRTDPMYSKGKEELEQLLRRIPIGSTLLRFGERIKDSLKHLVVPGMLFEELGFTYLGPVDGHDLKMVTTILNQARIQKGPVLVHVLTKKGKGYRPAERNPDRFHGVGAFNPATGEVFKSSTAPSYSEVFGRTLTRLAQRDQNILAITAAMTSSTGLNSFSRHYPERFFDVGIAEQHAVTLAAGLAKEGYHPVVTIYSTFLQRAYDQILHDVCLQKLPVTFAIDRAGLVGEDGATHHGLFDYAYLRHIPNMVIMAPRDENELQHMLATAVQHPGPTAVRYPRGTATGCKLDEELKTLPVGQARVLRKGKDVTLLAVGSMVHLAEEVAAVLASSGIDAAVINARFVKPLDEKCILDHALQTGKLYTLEEHVLQCGFGSAVMELILSRGLNGVTVQSFGFPDNFVEHGSPALLMARYGLTVEQVARSISEGFVRKTYPRKLRLAPS